MSFAEELVVLRKAAEEVRGYSSDQGLALLQSEEESASPVLAPPLKGASLARFQAGGAAQTETKVLEFLVQAE
mgnify:CR=1 FL=1